MATEDSGLDDETLMIVAMCGAVLGLLGTGLGWVEVTAIVDVSKRGYETQDGKLAILLLASALIVGPLDWDRVGRPAVTAIGGLLTLMAAYYLFVPTAVVPSTVLDGLTQPEVDRVTDTVDAGVGLVLTLLGSLIMAGAAGVAFARSRETDLATVTDSADDPDHPPSYADLDDERQAICAAVDARLDETSVLVDKDIRRLAFDEQPLGHDDPDSWWDEVEGLLRAHEEFEAMDDRGRRWQAAE